MILFNDSSYKINQAFSRLVFQLIKKQIWTRFALIKNDEIPESLTSTQTLQGYPIKIFSKGFQSSQIYWIGCCEPNLSNKLHQLVSPGDLFIDAGANLGYFSVTFGNLLKSEHQQGKILAFEPCTSTFKILKENIDANNLHDTVNLFPIGLGSEEETKILHLSTFNGLNTFCQPHFVESSTEEVKIKPLDSFYEYFTQEYKKCIIKIDVEGFEKQLLQGADKFLSDIRTQHIIVECFSGLDEIREILNDYGFKISTPPIERATYIASRF
ncbi:MAG: FkbM family methyltransferase [Rivularia sp. (in: cyanobacteria)]